MAGTVAGGKKAAATNKARYGESYYRELGHIGGKVSNGGGFRWMIENAPDKYEEALRKGIEVRRNRDRTTN